MKNEHRSHEIVLHNSTFKDKVKPTYQSSVQRY